MNMCVVITVAMVWLPFVVKGFWALRGNITTVAMVMLLKEVFNSYMLLCGNNALKRKTVHSSTAYYVHVLTHNEAKQMFTF
jgi:hypothetical protein